MDFTGYRGVSIFGKIGMYWIDYFVDSCCIGIRNTASLWNRLYFQKCLAKIKSFFFSSAMEIYEARYGFQQIAQPCDRQQSYHVWLILKCWYLHNDTHAMKTAHWSWSVMFTLLILPLLENTFVTIIMRWDEPKILSNLLASRGACWSSEYTDDIK